MIARIAFAVATLSALAGCATRPTDLSRAVPVPAERVLYTAPQSATNTAKLVVARDDGFIGGGCFTAFFLNGQLAARFDLGEVATFTVPAGEALLGAGRDPQGKGLCAFDRDNKRQRETILRPGETKSFRLSMDADGEMDISRID